LSLSSHRFVATVRGLSVLGSLLLSACGTLIGLGDLERAECSESCPPGRAEPDGATSGASSGGQGGGTQTVSGGALGIAGSALSTPTTGGTTSVDPAGGTNAGAFDDPGGAGSGTEGAVGGSGTDAGGGDRGGGAGTGGQPSSGGGGAGDLPIRINFQPLGAPVPSGYVPDTGLTFTTQAGLSFGWSVDHTDVTRDRGVNSNQVLDTLCQFHEGATWELALPNGTYRVLVSVGDASLASTYTLIVEGVTYWAERVIRANQFLSNSTNITISDGRLTLSQGAAGELATRINFIEVSAP